MPDLNLAEVLDRAATRSTTDRSAVRARGICTGCGRDRALTVEGRTFVHMWQGQRCPGMCQPPTPRELTVRDLLQAARTAGMPLHRTATGSPELLGWECVSDVGRVEILHWPSGGCWRVIADADVIAGTSHPHGQSVHLDMLNPSLTRVAAAARLCGWELPA